MIKKFGLVGYPLGHSFSKKYFTERFSTLGLDQCTYDLILLPYIKDIPGILRSDYSGLNVTIPYKTEIIDYLNDLDRMAWEIMAVNTLVRTGPYSWKGFNTDAEAFKISLTSWLGDKAIPHKALVLGSGGASKSVCYILSALGIQPSVVSRYRKRDFTYDELSDSIIQDHRLIINTTPLGMDPDTHTLPDIPYQALTSGHYLFDLVYNPINTLFLTRGQQQGAKTKNGLEMLHLQAELAWSIWKTYDKF